MRLVLIVYGVRKPKLKRPSWYSFCAKNALISCVQKLKLALLENKLPSAMRSGFGRIKRLKTNIRQKKYLILQWTNGAIPRRAEFTTTTRRAFAASQMVPYTPSAIGAVA